MKKPKKVIIEILLYAATGRNRLKGIFEYLRGRCDWDIRLPQTEADSLRELEKGADGIITSRIYPAVVLRRLEQANIPVVFLDIVRADRGNFFMPAVSVMNDNGGVGLLAARHFLAIGSFRSYGFVPHTVAKAWSERRLKGFETGLAKKGVVVTPFVRSGKISLGVYLKQLTKPAAVFCACDEISREVLEACREAKLKVPDQVAILGVVDDEFICTLARPGLSSIRIDTEGEGFHAAKELHRLMQNKKPGTSRNILLKPRGIIERASTKPPPPAAYMIREALAFIETNAIKGITPSDVCKRFGCSRSLLNIRFRQFHDKSVTGTITHARLEAVRRLLRSSDLKIGQLASECGFNNAVTLKNLFKRTYGLTMRDYRRSPNWARKTVQRPSE